MKTGTIEIKIPKEVMREAQTVGVNINRVKNAARDFILMEIIAQLSKLTKKDAANISKKIKNNVWKKLKKE